MARIALRIAACACIAAASFGIPAARAADDISQQIAALQREVDTLKATVEKMEKDSEGSDIADQQKDDETEKRFAKIEEKLKPLDLIGTSDKPPSSGGIVLRGPVTIQGAGGSTIASFSEDTGGAQLVIGEGSGKDSVRLTAGSQSTVEVGGQGAEVRLQVEGSKAFMMTTAGDGNSVVGSSDIGFGLYLNSAGGEPMAEIAQPQGKGMALRVYEGGQNVAAVGAVPGEGGSVRVFAPGGAKAAVTLFVDGGNGMVNVFNSGGEVAGSIDAKEQKIEVKGDSGIAALGKGAEGFGLTLKDKGGSPIADISQPPGKGTALRVYESGKQVAAIGSIPGEGGSVRVYSPGAEKAAVSMIAASAGNGELHVYGTGGGQDFMVADGQKKTLSVMADGGQEVMVADGQKKSLSVFTDQGSVVAGTREGRWGLFVGPKDGAPDAELTKQPGKGMALRVFNGASVVAAIGYAVGEGGAARVWDASGAAAAVLNATPEGGLVQVFKSGAPAAALVGKESAVAVYNSTGAAVASMGLSSNQSGGNVTMRDGGGQGVFSAGAGASGGGEACVDHRRGTGTIELVCLGVLLPSMGMGK